MRRVGLAPKALHARTHASTASTMPFLLRSDEELIAEATRALEELGVEVVLDSTSRSQGQCSAKVSQMLHRDNSGPFVVVFTAPEASPQTAAATIGTVMRRPGTRLGSILAAGPAFQEAVHNFLSLHDYNLPRNRDFISLRPSVQAWWREACRKAASGAVTCSLCQQLERAHVSRCACQQCQASMCAACWNKAAASEQRDVRQCTKCGTWRLDMTANVWGVPWDMPRPAATRTSAPAPSSALPRRMAAATGPDGWLRLPPRHQRTHPVDVLVDGVLAALDGIVMVWADVYRMEFGGPRDVVRMLRDALTEDFTETTLEDVRRHLKRVLPSVARQAARSAWHEVCVQVERRTAHVHPSADLTVAEQSFFLIRKRETTAAAAGGGDGSGREKSGGGRRGSQGGAAAAALAGEPYDWERDWELVQVAPGQWFPAGPDDHCERVQVAYLEPVRFELPGGVRRVLRDAHARLGGTACDAKQVIFLRTDTAYRGRQFFTFVQDRQGKSASVREAHAGRMAHTFLREARAADAPVYAYCRDLEAAQRTGLPEVCGEVLCLEASLLALEGLAWLQRQQRRRRPVAVPGEVGAARMPWEQRGGAGRRGRRRLAAGAVFELGPAGERRWALPLGEAAWVVFRALPQHP